MYEFEKIGVKVAVFRTLAPAFAAKAVVRAAAAPRAQERNSALGAVGLPHQRERRSEDQVRLAWTVSTVVKRH